MLSSLETKARYDTPGMENTAKHQIPWRIGEKTEGCGHHQSSQAGPPMDQGGGFSHAEEPGSHLQGNQWQSHPNRFPYPVSSRSAA